MTTTTTTAAPAASTGQSQAGVEDPALALTDPNATGPVLIRLADSELEEADIPRLISFLS